jgi:hypothetical protein
MWVKTPEARNRKALKAAFRTQLCKSTIKLDEAKGKINFFRYRRHWQPILRHDLIGEEHPDRMCPDDASVNPSLQPHGSLVVLREALEALRYEDLEKAEPAGGNPAHMRQRKQRRDSGNAEMRALDCPEKDAHFCL